MRITRWLIPLLLLTSCAVEKKGILVNVEPGTPMDESDLHQHCDLGDQAACVLSDSNSVQSPPPSLPLIQGVAPPDRATFAVLQPKDHPLFWYIYEREVSKLTKLFTVKPVSRGDSPYALQRLDARGLLPDHNYELLGGDAEGHLIEDRAFRTLETEAKPLRVEILTGWRLGSHEAHLKLLAAAHARNPQFLVLAGSAVNATLPAEKSALKGRASRDFFFTRQAEARAAFELGFEHDLIPVTALWNDDEFGKPDGDFTFPQRDEAREMMELFFPHWNDELSIVGGPGVSLSLDFRPMELILVDDLSFRQAPKAGEPVCRKPKGHKHEICKPGKPIPAPAGSRFGGILRDWVASRAAKAGRPVWLLTGGPTLMPYGADWNLAPAFADPALSRAPAQPGLWEVEAERGRPASLMQVRALP